MSCSLSSESVKSLIICGMSMEGAEEEEEEEEGDEEEEKEEERDRGCDDDRGWCFCGVCGGSIGGFVCFFDEEEEEEEDGAAGGPDDDVLLSFETLFNRS